jgi:ABC-2 type transport system ATP-binding protein
MNILEVINLKKTFFQNLKKTKVLKWVNIEVKKWEIYGFLWPNGAGKTTTLKCILRFLRPTEWNIKIFWKNLWKNLKLYNKIWYAPESTYFYDHLKWLEFMIFMWELSWMNKFDAKNKWIELMKKFWLWFATDKYVKSYSKWMKQRLWLWWSIINDPELIFWDEPMSWLDPLWRVLVKNVMKELQEKWKTFFFNTHILPDVQEIAHRFGIIYNWTIIYEDKIANIEWNLEDFFKNIIEKNTEEKIIIK